MSSFPIRAFIMFSKSSFRVVAGAKSQKERLPWQTTKNIYLEPFQAANAVMAFASEIHVKRGQRSVQNGMKDLVEKLGRNDLCPCGSGRKFQKMLSKIG
jgi:uncharacterized protein YecA (UPF0149 family)